MNSIFKIRLFYLALLIFFLTGVKTAQALTGPPENERFTVMVWNIWHGGKSKMLPVEDGRPDVIEIIRHTGADVVLMIETYGAAPMIAEALGYHYTLLSSNLCIFSRFPITNTFLFEKKISGFNFGGAEILVNNKYPMVFFDTWLHYLPDTRLVPTDKPEKEIISWEMEGTRVKEITAILDVIAPFLENSDKIPVIMGGDFNSHSHLDWTESTKDLYHHGGAIVEWPVSKAMEKAGFSDSFRELHTDPAEVLGVTWLHSITEDQSKTAEENYYGGHSRHDRIDYLYYRGETLKALESETYNTPFGQFFEIKGRRFMFPSDHGLVITTFGITR
jgi:endonuclease/exonuclease/phosphatase (EEP) superfamily protein YafD